MNFLNRQQSVVVASEWLSKFSAQHGVVLILHLDGINQLLWVSEKWDLNDKSRERRRVPQLREYNARERRKEI